MSEHSPEPWQLGSWGDNVFSVRDGDWNPICRVKRDDLPIAESQDRADARRIVACVNACTRISTEALEGGVVRELVEALQALRVYRDHFEECFSADCQEGGHGINHNASCLRARAVLAKVKP